MVGWLCSFIPAIASTAAQAPQTPEGKRVRRNDISAVSARILPNTFKGLCGYKNFRAPSIRRQLARASLLLTSIAPKISVRISPTKDKEADPRRKLELSIPVIAYPETLWKKQYRVRSAVIIYHYIAGTLVTLYWRMQAVSCDRHQLRRARFLFPPTIFVRSSCHNPPHLDKYLVLRRPEQETKIGRRPSQRTAPL